MEYILLAKIGAVVDVVVKIGYGIAGMYAVRTGVRYYNDYKYSVEQEEKEVI